jgi:hypothetical protein
VSRGPCSTRTPLSIDRPPCHAAASSRCPQETARAWRGACGPSQRQGWTSARRSGHSAPPCRPKPRRPPCRSVPRRAKSARLGAVHVPPLTTGADVLVLHHQALDVERLHAHDEDDEEEEVLEARVTATALEWVDEEAQGASCDGGVGWSGMPLVCSMRYGARWRLTVMLRIYVPLLTTLPSRARPAHRPPCPRPAAAAPAHTGEEGRHPLRRDAAPRGGHRGRE